MNSIASIAAGIYNAFNSAINALSPIFGPLFELVGSLAARLLDLTAATNVSGWHTFGKVVGWLVGILGVGFAAVKIGIGVFALLKSVIITLGVASTGLATPWALIIGAVAALAYGAYLLYLNWERVTTAFSNWGPVVAIKNAIDAVVEFLSGINLFDAGAGILKTLGTGIKSAVSGVIETVTGAFSIIRNLLPFSDAKEGPLSQLTASGKKLMDTLGQGVTLGAHGLKQAVSTALAGAALSTSIAVTPPPKMPAAAPPVEKVVVETRSSRSEGKGGKSMTIHIGSITLPGVKDGNDFVKELKRLVQQYDGS